MGEYESSSDDSIWLTQTCRFYVGFGKRVYMRSVGEKDVSNKEKAKTRSLRAYNSNWSSNFCPKVNRR